MSERLVHKKQQLDMNIPGIFPCSCYRAQIIVMISQRESSNPQGTFIPKASLLTDIAQIRAAEDVLALTRVLKESWLFGKLQTVGVSEAEQRAEKAAKKVAEGLVRLSGAEAEWSSGELVKSAGNSSADGNGQS